MMNKKKILYDIYLILLIIISIGIVSTTVLISLLWIVAISQVEQGGWIAMLYPESFAPITTISGLFLIVSGYAIIKKYNNILGRYMIPIGLICIIIVLIETFILSLLPLGMTK